jgi:hypothetical protein
VQWGKGVFLGEMLYGWVKLQMEGTSFYMKVCLCSGEYDWNSHPIDSTLGRVSVSDIVKVSNFISSVIHLCDAWTLQRKFLMGLDVDNNLEESEIFPWIFWVEHVVDIGKKKLWTVVGKYTFTN